MDPRHEHVLRTVEDQDIKVIHLWFCDVLGTLKSVTVSPAELEGSFVEGLGFDGSAIQGMARIYESDMLAKPDPDTFQTMPWQENAGTHSGHGLSSPKGARMFCDLFTPDGQPALADSRYVLRRAIERAEGLGFTLYVHPEIEFYLLESIKDFGAEPTPADYGGYFDNGARGRCLDFRQTVGQALEDMGVVVEFSHHEGGPGQNEIDLRSTDALTAADNIMTFRAVVKEVAAQRDLYATFMPKPFAEHPGSGLHTHLSLFDSDKNAFHDAGAQYELSKTGRQFIAGILRHSAEIAAVTNQFVNSYKRLWGGGEAPSYICWGHNNRSALVRVPRYKPKKATSSRIEHRGLDPATNPYLSLALLLAAGLEGIEQGYDLPDGAEDDVWSLSSAERRAMGIHPLPASLHEAIRAMEQSELVPLTLGEHVFDVVLRNKREEWADYRHQVTPYELRRYLPML